MGTSVNDGQYTDAELEKAVQDKGLTAPRVTGDSLDDVVVGAQYHRFPGTTLTVCAIELRNGFLVVGHSATASPENFDEEIGRRLAYDHARMKIWELEGYLLRQKLFEIKG